MKLRHLFVLVWPWALLSLDAQTAPAAPGQAAAPRAEAEADLAVLEQFLTLSDAELAQVEQAVAQVRAMSPAERAALREQIAAFRQLPADERARMRQGWGGMAPEIRQGWREMMQAATPERRAEIHAHLQSLSPEERVEYRRRLVEAYWRERKASP